MAKKSKLIFPDFPEFTPDYTPIQMMKMGVFGGSYFEMKFPGIAKRMGRNYKELRPDWEEVKFKIMLRCLRLKFAQPSLRKLLLETKDAKLCEGNTWHDNIFGNCVCDRCKNVKGRNQLGKLLMKVRKEIQDGKR